MTDAAPNVWSFLSLVVTAVVVPVVMWYLNKKQTASLEAKAARREAKLDEVKETVVKTEVLVNGDRAAKEQRIKALENQLRAAGHEPLI